MPRTPKKSSTEGKSYDSSLLVSTKTENDDFVITTTTLEPRKMVVSIGVGKGRSTIKVTKGGFFDSFFFHNLLL